jgi:hypothetical protein
VSHCDVAILRQRRFRRSATSAGASSAAWAVRLAAAVPTGPRGGNRSGYRLAVATVVSRLDPSVVCHTDVHTRCGRCLTHFRR